MNLKKCSWMFATLLLCPGLGWAQSSWPDFMPRLNSALSQSPVASVVPPDVVVEPPTPDVPPDKARWSGKWSGWACQDQACDTKLVVEKVTTAGATIVYAFASSGIKPFTARVEGQFVGDELQAALGNGAKLAYRMRKEGELEFLWRREAHWAAGILSKDK